MEHKQTTDVTAKFETVQVGLGTRAYDILIGQSLLEQSGKILLPHLARNKVVVVTDENVIKAQGALLLAGLDAADINTSVITLPAGEMTKSFSHLENTLFQLLDFGVDRGDMIVAFGGGVIGDLTGFAASILRRGCRFCQIPTTLLAQVDSSVGGKTGINVTQGKNLVGAFHQPSLVLADTNTLATLPDRQVKAGYAEVVKYGALGDRQFFDWLETNSKNIFAKSPEALTYAIKRSCEMKAEIVARDEREAGDRALLNLGHTFGHALEAVHGYSDTLLHGEGVAVGMSLAFEFSMACGLVDANDTDRLKAHLRDCGLPDSLATIPGDHIYDPDQLYSLIMQDKKVSAGNLSLVLARSIGDAFVEKDVKMKKLASFLKTKTSQN